MYVHYFQYSFTKDANLAKTLPRFYGVLAPAFATAGAIRFDYVIKCSFQANSGRFICVNFVE